jgi:hypothetical protein
MVFAILCIKIIDVALQLDMQTFVRWFILNIYKEWW